METSKEEMMIVTQFDKFYFEKNYGKRIKN